MRKLTWILSAVIWFNHVSHAQTCCSGGVPLSANLGLPAGEKGTWQFSLSYDFNQLKTLKTGDRELNDRRRERITHSILLETGYTISDRWSVDLFLSWVRQERHIFTPQGTNSTTTRGVGDGVVLFKYNFLPDHTRTSLVLGAGPKMPIGRTDKVSDQGFALPADLQPGSGSWDVVLWGFFSQSLKFRPSMSFTTTTTFRGTGVNPDYLGSIEYEFGNELQIITGIADRFAIGTGILDPSLSFRYRYAGRDTNNEVEIDATGGEWVFLLPGIKYSPVPSFSLNMTLEFPLYSFVNNTQLTPTNRYTAGIYYKLN
jgi:hypothetical protein